MAATVYCTSNPTFHQHSLTTSRSQYSPVLRRTTLSTFSSPISIIHVEQQSLKETIKSDENNNHQIEDTTDEHLDDILYIASDVEENNDANDDEHHMLDHIDAEEFLSLVGLRSKTKKVVRPNLTLRALTQRLASPVCLLPLPKYSERVRQALYIRLPFLKFLTITYDAECFCSTDNSAKAQSLLPRTLAQTRALSSLSKSPKKRKLPKTEFINMAVNTLHSPTNKISMNNPVHSALKCHVILDRLDQSTIDQIMQNSPEDDDTNNTSLLSSQRLLCKSHPRLSIVTNEPTMRREKPTVKRKSTTPEVEIRKRFKSINKNCARRHENPTTSNTSASSLTYKRIYLKCFLCSKRDYVDAQVTHSDVLHSHWLEHGGNLSLNIYDTEIESILTRVVEFYKSSKQHMLEGKVKTVFILNSKEIKCTSSSNNFSSNDSYIVID